MWREGGGYGKKKFPSVKQIRILNTFKILAEYIWIPKNGKGNLNIYNFFLFLLLPSSFSWQNHLPLCHSLYQLVWKDGFQQRERERKKERERTTERENERERKKRERKSEKERESVRQTEWRTLRQSDIEK